MREGWKIVCLEDVVKIVNGGTPKTKVSEFWGGEHLWITPAEMGGLESPYLADSRRKLTERGLQGSSASLVPENSVILSTRAPIGHLIINVKPMAFNQGCRGIVAGDDAFYKFIYYFLLSNVELLNYMGSGATFKELSAGKLKKINLPLPGFEEQKYIAAILDEAFEGIDMVVANTEKNLANVREIFDSALECAFPLFRDGSILVSLADLIDVTHGFAYKGKEFGAGLDVSSPIVLTPGNYSSSGELIFNEKNTKRYVGEVDEKYLFSKGDLTVVMTDLSSKMKILGKPAFVCRDDVLHNQRIGRVLFKSDLVEKKYLYYFLRSDFASSALKKTSTGTMVKHTAPKRILGLRIPMPEKLDEQKLVVRHLEVLEADVIRLEEIYNKKLTALAELKQSLLHKAFSGELTVERVEVAVAEATA